MTFAKFVFIGAGIWALTVLAPLYALIDITGRRYVAPTQYPQFFYGFLAVAIAWQVAFLVVGTNPARFRTLMIPCIIEKLSYVATLILFFASDRISALDAQPAWPDGLLGLLFIVAFVVTRPPVSHVHASTPHSNNRSRLSGAASRP